MSAVERWVTSLPAKRTVPAVSFCSRLMALKKRGLAGPVRADEGDDPSGGHLERDLVDGLQAAEVDREVLDLEEDLRRWPGSRGHRPRGCRAGAATAAPAGRLRASEAPIAVALPDSWSASADEALDRLLQLLPPEERLQPGPLIGPQRKPGGQEDQEQDHDDGVDDARVLLDAGEPVDDPGHDDGPDHRAPDRAAPEHHHDDGKDGGGEGEGGRGDGQSDEREQTAGQTADDGAGDEGEEFPVRGPHPQSRGGDLAGRDPAQSPAHAVLERAVHEQDDDDGDHPDQVVLAQVACRS